MAKKDVQLYDCEVRLGGNIGHTVPRRAVTIQEIMLLRAIHGEDSVPDGTIKESGRREIDEKEELFELARKYASTSDPLSGKKAIERVFNVPLIGFEQWLEDQLEYEALLRDESHRNSQTEIARMIEDAKKSSRDAVREPVSAT